MITISPSAIDELKSLLAGRGPAGEVGLRLAVVPGGCAGWQYEMKVAVPDSGDEIIDRDGVRVIVAKDSVSLLSGSEVDYVDDLGDRGFRIHNPQASRSCGCGTSFESVTKPSDQPPLADGEACGT